VSAPAERCFDLSRSIELHTRSAGKSRERAVAGVTSGLISAGQEVTWHARHLGAWRTLTSRITAYERPRHFHDSMVRGAFRRFDHDHHFEAVPGGTRMRDVFDFDARFGWAGQLAARLFLTRYMRGFLERRNAVIRAVAESAEWESYLPPGAGD
jgi:ligand-binding SRPBCC domain-containing protein